MEVFLSKASNSTPADSYVYGSCRRHFEELIGPYERCTSPLASYSDDTCIMREQAMEAVVFGAGGVRFRGEADGKGLGIGGEAVSIADMLSVARVYAATAVDTCGKTRERAQAPRPVGRGSRVIRPVERREARRLQSSTASRARSRWRRGGRWPRRCARTSVSPAPRSGATAPSAGAAR